MRPPLEADLVVVGSGVAGLAAALAAASEAESAGGIRILVLTPGPFGVDGASTLAQGGIAAAVHPGDSPALHALDTRRAGAGLTVAERVEILAAEGPERVRELARMGVRFDREPGGALALGLEGAHSRRRIVHALGDRTGWEVTRVLSEAALQCPGVRIFEGAHVTGLVMGADAASSGRNGSGRNGASAPRSVAGVRYTDPEGQTGEVHAPLTLLATGGACRLFLRTTAPHFALGDGLALAAGMGARLDGMEFVQFHPTALRVEADPLPLVTEALRGEGASLVDASGRRIFDLSADVVAPSGLASRGRPSGDLASGDLASRAEVARRLWLAMQEGVEPFLDARKAVGNAFPDRFPGVYRLCLAHGIDPVRDLIPVTPAAHYHMGGVAVDAWGRSTVPGLRAAGEVASTGIHGANRLASNSLLEGLVYGKRAGEAAVRDLASGRLAALAPVPGFQWPLSRPGEGEGVGQGAAVSGLRAGSASTTDTGAHTATVRSDADLLLELRSLLWDGVGVVRDAAGLMCVLAGLNRIESEASSGTIFRAVLVGRAMATAALAREASLGSHLRSDALPEAPTRAAARRDLARLVS
ncbi:L-aspartate oxidase [soil metagenome]